MYKTDIPNKGVMMPGINCFGCHPVEHVVPEPRDRPIFQRVIIPNGFDTVL